MFSREIILRGPESFRPVSAVRSSLVQSSVATLRERGHYEQYVKLLERHYHDAILDNLAPAWLPCDVVEAHYRACDALRLEYDDIVSNGRAVGDRMQGSYIGVVAARGARLAGVTPWILLQHLDRIWARVFQGGAVSVVKVGPKDAVMEIRGVELARFDYFRIAFSGLFIAAGLMVGALTPKVQPIFGRCGRDHLVYRAAWV